MLYTELLYFGKDIQSFLNMTHFTQGVCQFLFCPHHNVYWCILG